MPSRLQAERAKLDTVRRYIRLLARPQVQALLHALSRQPQSTQALAAFIGGSVESTRRRLRRLEAEGFVVSERHGRIGVFRLTERASVSHRAGKLSIRLEAADGTGVTVKVRHRAKA